MVDDEKLVVKYIASVISKLGYPNVFQATNATEARAHLQAEKIALIISDVCLPDGDGRQLLREALERNPAIACVLITGFATDELNLPVDLRNRVLLLGKPFTADDISHVLAEFVDRAGGETVAARP